MEINKLNTAAMNAKIRFSTYGNVGQRSTFTGTYVGEMFGSVVPNSQVSFVNHNNIYPTLPDSIRAATPNDYTKYPFAIIIIEDGSTLYIGKPWIIETTLELVVNRTAVVEIVNFQDADLITLRKQLEALNRTVGNISLVINN